MKIKSPEVVWQLLGCAIILFGLLVIGASGAVILQGTWWTLLMIPFAVWGVALVYTGAKIVAKP